MKIKLIFIIILSNDIFSYEISDDNSDDTRIRADVMTRDEYDIREENINLDKVLSVADFEKRYQYPRCNEDKIAVSLVVLHAISPEVLIASSTFDDLEDTCIKQSVELDKLEAYLKTCQPPSSKDLYMQLIRGVEALYSMICLDECFKKKFTQSFLCLHEMSGEFDDCYGPEDWTENTNPERVCCTALEIIDCFKIKTAKLCGKQSSELMETIAQNVLQAIIPFNCDNSRSFKGRIKQKTKLDSDGLLKTNNGPSHRINFSSIFLPFIIYLRCTLKMFLF